MTDLYSLDKYPKYYFSFTNCGIPQSCTKWRKQTFSFGCMAMYTVTPLPFFPSLIFLLPTMLVAYQVHQSGGDNWQWTEFNKSLLGLVKTLFASFPSCTGTQGGTLATKSPNLRAKVSSLEMHFFECVRVKILPGYSVGNAVWLTKESCLWFLKDRNEND